MANLKTSIKDVRQNRARRKINDSLRTKYRKALKSLRNYINNGDKEKATLLLSKVSKLVDKAAKKNIVKKNTASRIKSRSAKAVNSMSRTDAPKHTANME